MVIITDQLDHISCNSIEIIWIISSKVSIIVYVIWEFNLTSLSHLLETFVTAGTWAFHNTNQI